MRGSLRPVGHDAGERILGGHIRRGDIEEIHAAIWLSSPMNLSTSAPWSRITGT
jgi:hypothetical protein